MARHAAAAPRPSRRHPSPTPAADCAPLTLAALQARLAGPPAPAAAAPVPLLAADFIAGYRAEQSGAGSSSVERQGQRDPEGSRRTRTDTRAGWRAALPALVRPSATPLRALVQRPVLTVAVALAAAATTAAATAPAAPARQDVAEPGVSVAMPGANLDAIAIGTHDATAQVSEGRVSRDQREPLKTNATTAMKKGQTVPGTWILPAPGVITSCFCMRWGVMHLGVDIAKGYGVPIRAVGAGTVIKVGPAAGFGNWVVIQHSNGDVSIYGHMESYSVREGQKVKAGQVIALEGSMGYSTGPHLHFEVHKGGLDGPAIDPIPWLRARGVTIPKYDPNG